MSLKVPRLAIRGLVIAFALAVGGEAQAADARQIADAFVAAATARGENTASYASATAEGDDVVVTGLTVKGNEDDEPVTLPRMVVTGATPRTPGGFTAARISIDATSLSSGGQTVAWQTFAVENAVVPSPEEVKSNAHLTPFSRLEVGGITLTSARFPTPMEIASFGVALTADPDGTPRSFAVNLTGMKFPPDFFANSRLASAYLGMLGYTDGFMVDFGVEGSYENATDTLTLSGLSFDTADVGKLTISGKFSGVSLRKLGAMQVGDVQSTGKLENFKLRFDNEGIVERLLDMQAKTQGIKREDAVAMATGALPFLLMTVPNEAFQAKVVGAATTFLNQPKSITFSAAPKEPVPFATLFDVLGDEPETLPDVLGADVTAND